MKPLENKMRKSELERRPLPSGNPQSCTGCGACAAICPNDSIALWPDDEGFVYPVTDIHTCTDCGFCRQVCPVNPEEKFADGNAADNYGAEPLTVFASWHLDENIRRESSSGGVFSALAENILAKGGVVVGAAFDEQFVVRHTLIETTEDLHRLRGSKYVQSEISPHLYQQIRDLLRQERPVLFSGTPCQVAGLRRLCRNCSDNLFFCDIVCHGIPSPRLFAEFVKSEATPEKGALRSISFREKEKGWKKFILKLVWANQTTTIQQSSSYMAAFLRNYTLRPCCYGCKFTNTNRAGDLTMADFWGVAKKYPEYDYDDKGTSLILVNTDKGQAWLEGCQSSLFLGVADLDTAIAGNPMLARPCNRPPQRETFYLDLKELTFTKMVNKYGLHGPTKSRLLAGKIKRTLRNAFFVLFPRRL